VLDAGSQRGQLSPLAEPVGGMEAQEAKRLKELEKENTRLKKMVADLMLDKEMLKDLAAGNI